MRFTRRRFLVLGFALSAAAAWVGRRSAAPGPGPSPEPALGHEPPGPLGSPAMAALIAAAGAVTGYAIDPAHYAEYYRWRAEHLRGYRVLYERFARDADRAARARGARSFAAATREIQLDVLGRAAPARGGRPLTVWERLRADVAGDPWPLYERFVVRETLALFARTDAWIALGYRGWPGVPKGLDRFRLAPG